MNDAAELHLDEAAFRQLAEVLRGEIGLLVAPEMRPTLERRLRERVLALGLPSFAEYARLLRERQRAELDEAIELVTVNETYFFREALQLRAFQADILPALLENKSSRRVDVWSAGCSTGEEAYTIAITLLEADLPSAIAARVLGTDISRRCIAHARRGVYGRSAFRSTPAELRHKYFVSRPDGEHVSPEVKAMTSFSQQNLLNPAKGALVGRMDVVFCRNVLIYLDDPSRARLLELFHERLAPGGFLLLGHSESLLNVDSPFEHVHLGGELVYRKPRAPSGGASERPNPPGAR